MNIMQPSHPYVGWVFEQHNAINHVYEDSGNGFFPYTYHLSMAADAIIGMADKMETIGVLAWLEDQYKVTINEIVMAAYAHDLLENVSSRVSYNDFVKYLKTVDIGEKFDPIHVAEMVLAVTDFPGRTPEERKPSIYWENIRNTPGAILVKIGDTMANVQHGINYQGSMLKKYVSKHVDYCQKLQLGTTSPYIYCRERLDDLIDQARGVVLTAI